jgi:Domain of unknown function (DUF4376)
MAAYQLTTSSAILRTSDGAVIPADPANADYQAYLAWVAAGGVADSIPISQVQTNRIATLQAAYDAAIVVPVAYTSRAGVAKTYQADPASVANLQAALAGLGAAGATPTGFYWVAADNTQVPFTFADLQGLAAAMLAQGWAAFQHLQTQKAAVRAAATVADVQAVVW